MGGRKDGGREEGKMNSGCQGWERGVMRIV